MIKADISHFGGAYAHVNANNRELKVSRLMLARCVMMVGQSGLRDALGMGLFRLGELCCLAMGNTRANGETLMLSERFWRLEQTEKVCVSFHLGMGLAKAVSELILRLPWLTHLNYLNDLVILQVGVTRASKLHLYDCDKTPLQPDLIGFDIQHRAHIFEAKGYSSGINTSEIQHAINQVSQVVAVNGFAPETHVVSYFDLSQVPFRGIVIDPEGEDSKGGIDISLELAEFVNAYYSVFLNDDEWSRAGRMTVMGRQYLVRPVGAPNIFFGIDGDLFDAIKANTIPHEAIAFFNENYNQFLDRAVGFSIGSDGTILIDIDTFNAHKRKDCDTVTKHLRHHRDIEL